MRLLQVIRAIVLLSVLGGTSVARADVGAALTHLMDETALAIVRVDASITDLRPKLLGFDFVGPFGASEFNQQYLPLRESLAEAGVRQIMFITQVPRQLIRSDQQISLDAVAVVPCSSADVAERIAALLEQQVPNASWSVAARNQFCVFGPRALVASALAGNHPPRPDLAPAWAAAADAPWALVVAPSPDQRLILASMLPTLPAGGGGAFLQHWAAQTEWTMVAHTPAQALRVVIRAESPDHAAELAKTSAEFLNNTVAKVRKIGSKPVQLGPFLKHINQHVENQHLEFSADLESLPKADNPFISVEEAIGRLEDMQRLMQIGLALHNYYSVHRQFPNAAIVDADGNPLLSWRVAILPYLGERELYEAFRLDEPWDSPHNRQLIERMPDAFRVGDPEQAKSGKTAVQFPISENTMWPNGRGILFRDIIDGTSNTIAVIETVDSQRVTWTQPSDWAYDPEHPSSGLGSSHSEGFLALMADGSARFFPATLDLDLLRGLFTPNGHEPPPGP